MKLFFLLILSMTTWDAHAAKAKAQPNRAPASGAPQGVIQMKRGENEAAYPKNPILTDQEDIDRVVDEAAVSSKEAAILNLKRLLKLKKGTPEEPALLWRLADMEWRATKSHFRVGMSRGEKAKSNVRYEELLGGVIEHTGEIITRFPKFKDMRDVLLRRGRAYQELKKSDSAEKDYLTFISRYPNDLQIVPVRLMAAELQFDQNKYADVLKTLEPVDLKQNNSGLNGNVVEKQALSYFHLEKYSESIERGEWLVRYDVKRGLDQENGGHFDQVIGMLALFYGSAVEKKHANYDLPNAFNYFVRLEAGKYFGKLSHEFTLVLRSKDLQTEVFNWKELVIKKATSHDEIAKTLVAAYDAAITWKRYDELAHLEEDFKTFFAKNPEMQARLGNEEYYRKFKKEVLDFAERIYKTIPTQNAKPGDFQAIADPYLRALSAYMTLGDSLDPMKAKVRFRIGEFYLGLKDWERAQANFSEIYQTQNYVADAAFRDQARVKAMTARYDYFKDRGIVPKDLKAVSLKSPNKAIPGDVAEWIKWIDEVSPTKKTDDEAFEKLIFEANRVIYSYGQVEIAYKRMLYFVGSRPNSKLTPPTCALLVDTLIESEAWVAVRTLAQKFLTMPNVAVGEYKTKLESLERDAHFKIVASYWKSQEFDKVLAMGEEHLKLYPNSKYRPDVLAFMGKAALEQKNTDLSLSYLKEVADKNPTHESAYVAFFIKGQDAEKKFEFLETFINYEKLLIAPSNLSGIAARDLPQFRKKTFLIGLNTADAGVYKQLGEGKHFCGNAKVNDLMIECDRLAGIQSLFNEKDRRSGWDFISIAEKAPKESRAIWYAAAFARGAKLPTPVLMRSIEEFKRTANSLDPMSQGIALFSARRSIQRFFDAKIENVETDAKISSRIEDLKYSLERRVREISRVEGLGSTLLSIPDPEIKVYVLGRMAKVFKTLAHELATLPPPRGLKPEEVEQLKLTLAQVIQPIEAKSDQIGTQAWEIASQSGVQSPYTPGKLRETYAGLDTTPAWDVLSSLVRGVSAAAAEHSWAKSIRGGNFYASLYFQGLVDAGKSNQLGLAVEDLTILQMATALQLGRPSELVKIAKNQEKLVKGEALRLSVLSRMYFYTLARSPAQLEALNETFRQSKLRDQEVGELEFLKVAKSFDRQESRQLGKAAPQAPEKQPSRMPASVKPAPAVERKTDPAPAQKAPAGKPKAAPDEAAEGIAL